MEAKSTDRKTFQLTENGQPLGELLYENMFFLSAEIKLTNSKLYEIRPVGFFQTSIKVTKDGGEIATLVMNWRGEIVITFNDGREYILKSKGILNNKFNIENSDGEKLIQFDPEFNWSKFNYNYKITYDRKPEDNLLFLIGVYASNYLIAIMSGASTGMG